MIVGLVKGCLLLQWEILAWTSLGGTHSFPIETLPQAQPSAWATVPKGSALAPTAAYELTNFVPPRLADLLSPLAVSGGGGGWTD